MRKDKLRLLFRNSRELMKLIRALDSNRWVIDAVSQSHGSMGCMTDDSNINRHCALCQHPQGIDLDLRDLFMFRSEIG